MFVTIITPTYNRAHLLNELYISLKEQTVKNFEWVIVDDGSKDETKKVVEQIIESNCTFDIKYLYQINGGKHRAVNRGVLKAKYEYIFVVDSDDILLPNAMDNIDKWLEDVKNLSLCAGVAGLKATKNTKKILGNSNFNRDYIDARNTERRKFGLLGDKAEIYRKDLLLKYPFMEFENENFLTEDTVWNEISYQGYFIRWYNEVIYLCEYLNDGLTKQGDCKDVNNFVGFTYSIKQRIKCNGFLDSIIAKGRFYYIAKKKGLNISEMKGILECTRIELLICYVLWCLKNRVYKR